MSGGSECDRGECVSVARFLYNLEKRSKNDMLDFLVPWAVSLHDMHISFYNAIVLFHVKTVQSL